MLGLFIRIREKLRQGYKKKSFLIIGDYKKIWNHAKIFLFVRPQYCPPPFSPPVSVRLGFKNHFPPNFFWIPFYQNSPP